MTSTEIANASKVMLGTTQADAMYIGSTLLWTSTPSVVTRVPQGYTQLEYISSDANSQYIDLDIKLHETAGNTFDIATKFVIYTTSGDNNNQGTIFSTQNTTNPWPGTFIRRNSNDVVGRYIGGTNKDNYWSNLIGLVIEITEKTPPDKNVYYTTSNTHNFGTSLFCAFSDANGTPYRLCGADLYYFKLWFNGTLVRDMVPCKDPNNVVGLYDVVNNKFYSSPNGAAFIAGPAV